MYADLALLINAAPDDEDVVAGPIGAAVFVGLVIAVALLLWNFTKQLKKVERAREAGVYGDPPVQRDGDADPTGPGDTSSGPDGSPSGSSSSGD